MSIHTRMLALGAGIALVGTSPAGAEWVEFEVPPPRHSP